MNFRICIAIFSILSISLLGIIPWRSAPVVAKNIVEFRAIRIDPEGNFEEQLAYHQAQVKKFQEAVIKEDVNARNYLSRQMMNEVRQANSRKFQYVRKIEEHLAAIEELKNEP